MMARIDRRVSGYDFCPRHSRLQLPAKNLRQTRLFDPLLGDADHGVVEFVAVIIVHIDTIPFKKFEGGSHAVRLLPSMKGWF